MVEPTNLKPAFCSALAMASLSGDLVGTSLRLLGRFFFGLPPTKLHKNFANEPSCSISARKALALLTLASILPLWRMMPGSARGFFDFAGVEGRVFFVSQPA